MAHDDDYEVRLREDWPFKVEVQPTLRVRFPIVNEAAFWWNKDVVLTVIKIRFNWNWTTDKEASKCALNLRHDGNELVGLPEFLADGVKTVSPWGTDQFGPRSEPALYSTQDVLSGDGPILQVAFKAHHKSTGQPLTGQVWVGAYSDGILGSLDPQAVTFVGGSHAKWIEFQCIEHKIGKTGLLGAVSDTMNTFNWFAAKHSAKWLSAGKKKPDWDAAQILLNAGIGGSLYTTTHRILTVLRVPAAPWEQFPFPGAATGKGVGLLPRVDMLQVLAGIKPAPLGANDSNVLFAAAVGQFINPGPATKGKNPFGIKYSPEGLKVTLEATKLGIDELVDELLAKLSAGATAVTCSCYEVARIYEVLATLLGVPLVRVRLDIKRQEPFTNPWWPIGWDGWWAGLQFLEEPDPDDPTSPVKLMTTAEVNKLPIEKRRMWLENHEFVALVESITVWKSLRVFDATYFLQPGGTGTPVSPAPAWLGQPFQDSAAPIDYARRLLEYGNVSEIVLSYP